MPNSKNSIVRSPRLWKENRFPSHSLPPRFVVWETNHLSLPSALLGSAVLFLMSFCKRHPDPRFLSVETCLVSESTVLPQMRLASYGSLRDKGDWKSVHSVTFIPTKPLSVRRWSYATIF